MQLRFRPYQPLIPSSGLYGSHTRSWIDDDEVVRVTKKPLNNLNFRERSQAATIFSDDDGKSVLFGSLRKLTNASSASRVFAPHEPKSAMNRVQIAITLALQVQEGRLPAQQAQAMAKTIKEGREQLTHARSSNPNELNSDSLNLAEKAILEILKKNQLSADQISTALQQSRRLKSAGRNATVALLRSLMDELNK